MTTPIYKLDPLTTVSLRGFDGFGAAAAMHSATHDGFIVSGVFRDASDFAVLVLYDTTDFFDHPRMKYLPDPDLAGLVLQFDVRYRNLMPLDSPKFPTIDWPYLDVTRQDGTSAQIPLFDHAELVSGAFFAAVGTVTVSTTGATATAFDRVTLWFQNIAFDYICAGGETAAQIMDKLRDQINGVDWTSIGGLNALLASTMSGGLFIGFARYGKVSTSGYNVTLLAGNSFVGLKVGDAIMIDGVMATVQVRGAKTLVVSVDLGSRASVNYLALRGGRDGNMVTMYAQTSGTVSTNKAVIPFDGGSSDITWRVTLDFTALGIDSVRQMWLTFAPRLSFAGPYVAEEWDAVFTNWQVTGVNRPLKVAGPGSVRIEDSDSWCTYKGNWEPTINGGFYSQGFAKVASITGNSVTIKYWCQEIHDLWLGTALYVDRGRVNFLIDGGIPATIDTYLSSLDPVVTRVKLASAIAAGEHTVTITTLDAKPFYFDFLEAVVASDVPDAIPNPEGLGVAIDYDTDSTYKISPARILAIQENLGLDGVMDHYVGVFFWNQRKRQGGYIPTARVRISGPFTAGDQIFIVVGGLTVGKTVFQGDSTQVIADHLAFFANEVFSGAWARVEFGANGYEVVIASHSASAAYNFTLTASATSSTGTVTLVGSLTGGIVPTWVIDETIRPVINYGARTWHADLYRQCAARGRRIASAFSTELVNPPDQWAQRFPDGSKPDLDTGFASLKAVICAFIPDFLTYQIAAFREIAELQSAAGLVPELQFGEFSWWYFAGPGGMAFYDDGIKAAALVALGRPLHVFLTPDDDPFLNKADADFLANRLAAYVMAITLAVEAAYPDALFEWLLPMDVNAAQVQGKYALGGRLLNYINIPAELIDPGGVIDILKIEALDFELGDRNVDFAKVAMAYPASVGWPADRVRYLVGCSNPGAPFHHSLRAAQDAGIQTINFWAWDHILLFGWDVRKKVLPEGQVV